MAIHTTASRQDARRLWVLDADLEALHGMEQAAGVGYWEGSTLRAAPGTPVLVRYADDLAALWASRAQAEQVKAQLAEWLEPRGLAFSEAKTRIVHLSQGFDSLGFSIRRYPDPGTAVR